MMGPTAAILTLAQKAPGGVIRWHEARDEYLSHSEAAKRDERRASRPRPAWSKKNGNRQYHMNLNRVLLTHFLRVDGTQGFYVLKHSIVGEP